MLILCRFGKNILKQQSHKITWGMERNGMEKRKKFITNVIFYAIIGSIAIGIYKYILPVTAPFIVAFILAALIQLPVRKWGGVSLKRKKAFAVLLCGSFYTAFFLSVTFAGLKLLEGAGNIIASAPVIYSERIVPALEKLVNHLETAAAPLDACMSQKIESDFQTISQGMGKYISEFSVKAVEWISTEAVAFPGFVIKIVITIVATFFMAADFDRIIAFFKKLIPEEKQELVKNGGNYIKNILFLFLKSYSILFLLTFTELSVGFLIIGIPYAFLCAFAIALFDILPALGTGGILVPWALILFVMGDTALAIEMLVLETTVTVIRNIVEPKIVGRQIGLHPLAALISMYVGLKTFGIIGMFCFPVMAVIAVNFEKNGIKSFSCPYTTV